MSNNHILFLCTGNYYRSRYAEELFNHQARLEGLNWRAFSRGAAEKGSLDNVGPISKFALQGLQAKSIVAEGAHRYPQPCCLADFDGADLVIALKEAEHRPLVERRFPAVADRVRYWHVHDIDVANPADALAMIDRLMEDLLRTLR
ncbi:low molecular weight phosphatase family protein [Bradyrhizobium sp. BRP22]|uniref:arsenate-mycothiol transferase ArsC n=1 Tax=Bradyrhizobium sp. BRP22 TaxID=2793821 RepID=UPI001CD3A4B5|nr:low molecular weight phosphatase family protein [Bradyrhizobium sp. BRP22]MCA1453023.1 low molecular weight phosphatase family protein [Bradyrhizobium sp. BRP22]